VAPVDRPDRGISYDSRDIAEAWHRSGTARSGALGPATELMLDLAGVGPGCSVLDLAAGTGDQTLLAALRVGLTGSVLATDIAASMLEVAAAVAHEAGLANVATRVMDAQELDLPADCFDAAICRSGLMLLPDPLKALTEVRRVLKPGGRFAAVVFSAPEKNPYAARPSEIVRRIGNLPPPAPDQPGMFALGAPGALDAAFQKAGFRDVTVRTVPTRRHFATVDEALRNCRDSFPSLLQLMDRLSDAEREQAWAEIEQELRRIERPDGIEVVGEVLVGAGKK